MDVDGAMDGPGFLEPIPEDVSLAASQHSVNLSTASAVASSDSGGLTTPTDSTMSTVKDRFQRQGRGRRGRKRDVGQTDRTKIFESGGQSDLVGDNLSDANASLGGANEYSFGPPVSAFAMGEEVDDSSKPTFSSEKCKKCSLTVLVIVLMLTTVIGVGMHLIFGRLPEETAASPENDVSNIASFADQSSSPTAIPKFAVFVMPSITPTPSPTSPTHSPSDVKSLDETLLKIQGTTKENLFDINTPEGKGRDWILNSDRMINVEEEQKNSTAVYTFRLILCYQRVILDEKQYSCFFGYRVRNE
mmetsp:Transcript_12023/g.27860  ORF Transcript_12023/g.27860 Transcript_12023/m.27860 type:complete len:303 (-) Transcript_12023:1049-1957(-)